MNGAVLFLSPHASIRQDPERLIVETPEAVFEFGCGQPDELHRALNAFACGSSLQDAAGDAFMLGQLTPVVDALTDNGGLVNVAPMLGAKTPDAWLSTYFNLCDRWALDIFASEFWTSVLSGAAPTRLVLGWAVEFYHRTVGADEHNALSVRHCSDPLIKTALEDHFREECGHGEIFLRGLAKCAVSRDAVMRSAPLPTTRALIEYMNALAVSDSLAYLGCYGVLHAPRHGQTVEKAIRQFTRLCELYPAAAGALGAMQEHAVIDLSLRHEQIELGRYVRVRGAPSRPETLRIINAARGMALAFSRFFEGIHARHAARPTAGPPRAQAMPPEVDPG